MALISVLMPVYNGARYVGEAIESVLTQTFEDFEFIIVDDGSSDVTPDILANHAARDGRIRLVRNDVNLGLIRSLNKGLDIAGGELVARIDADDLCRPERLERQVTFLKRNPNCVLLGTGYDAIDENGRVTWSKSMHLDDVQIRWLARFIAAPLQHSSAMFRRLSPVGEPWTYDEKFEAAEDCDLWQRMLQVGCAEVLPEVLICYRVHQNTISANHGPIMARNALKAAKRQLESTLPARLSAPLTVFLHAYVTRESLNREQIRSIVTAFDEMLKADIASCPRHERWFRRRAAGILAQGVLERAGAARDWRLLRAFLMAAWHHLPWLAARTIEDRGTALFLLRRRAFGR